MDSLHPEGLFGTLSDMNHFEASFQCLDGLLLTVALLGCKDEIWVAPIDVLDAEVRGYYKPRIVERYMAALYFPL